MRSEETPWGLDFTARACASTYRIAAGLWFMLFLPALYFRHVSNAWPMLAIVGLTFAFVLYWVRSFEISISANTLSYRSLLVGTRTLRLNEIATAEIKVDTETRIGPVWKLILFPEPPGQPKPIIINMKVFSKPDMNRVFDFLGPKLKERRFTPTKGEREAMMRNWF